MSEAHADGKRLLLLGSAIFILFGAALEFNSPFGLMDFKALYYGARCVFLDHDPYQQSEFVKVFLAEGGRFPAEGAAAQSVLQGVSICINPPTSLLLITPLAFLPWSVAAVTWMVLIAAGLTLAAFLVWDVGCRGAPEVSGFLAFLVLANSELLLLVGNAAGIAISLCVIAACCFIRNVFIPAGVICLAAGMLLKPHDVVWVWLFFLLAGGRHRKRALQTLLITAAMAVLAVAWVMRASPDWAREMLANISATSMRGGLNDPGPTSMGGHGLGMVVSLHSLLSFFADNPHFYNTAAWLIGGLLLLICLLKVVRSSPNAQNAWFALAAISALTLLPVYHRAYDAKLLLLTLPACAILWRAGGRAAWCALSLNIATFLCTGDLFWGTILYAGKNSPQLLAKIPVPLQVAIQVAPAPLLLLALGIFYLWAFIRPSLNLTTQSIENRAPEALRRPAKSV